MKDFAPPKHPNDFEHKETFIKFLSYFIFYGFLGALLGRSIDNSIEYLNNEEDSRQKQIGLFFLQILINGIIFFVAFQTLTFKFNNINLTFDDWISSTFQGLIFATTMYSMQNKLFDNLKNGMF